MAAVDILTNTVAALIELLLKSEITAVLNDPVAGDPAHAGVSALLEQVNVLDATPIHDVSSLVSALLPCGQHIYIYNLCYQYVIG